MAKRLFYSKNKTTCGQKNPAHFSVHVKQQLLSFCFPLRIWIHNVTFSYINYEMIKHKLYYNEQLKICRFKTYHLLTTLLCCFTNALLPKAVKNKKNGSKKNILKLRHARNKLNIIYNISTSVQFKHMNLKCLK